MIGGTSAATRAAAPHPMRTMPRARALEDPVRVPETLSVQEVAHHAAHSHGGEGHRGLREGLIELVEALLLAIVAIATAWSGYQAARWDGRQAELYSISSREHALETESSTRNGQERLYDATNFSFWLESSANGDRRAEALFRRRFRPQFVPAFEAWLATKPFTNPSAPAGPQVMPQYKVALDRGAAVHGARAEAAFEEGTHAREQGERYVRDTILLATVLFLTALAPRFKVRVLRLGLIGVSLALLVIALYFIGTYPRA
jgi:hypothetical protein